MISIEQCRQLPKIELHAHLHGCIRKKTVLELYHKKFGDEKVIEVEQLLTGDRTLKDCFRLFDIVHSVIETGEQLRRITREVIEDFIADGVVYAEIRTTPREFTMDQPLTEKEGIDIILDEIRRSEQLYGDRIIVRLLLSINRSESKEKAMRTVEMAIDYKNHNERLVVGVDLSGNPTCAPFAYFQSCFEILQAHDIPIVIHMGEVPNDRVLTSPCVCSHEDVGTFCDTDDILAFKPARLGHALFLSEKNKQDLHIPIEMCPTSNLMTLGLGSLERHPIINNLMETIPTSINTDDPFIFDVMLSDEYWKVANTLNWDIEELVNYVRRVEDQILDSSKTVHNQIRSLLEAFHNSL